MVVLPRRRARLDDGGRLLLNKRKQRAYAWVLSVGSGLALMVTLRTSWLTGEFGYLLPGVPLCFLTAYTWLRFYADETNIKK